MNVVLDTNVLVSGFFFGGVPGQILEAWRNQRVTIVLSAPILAEHREVGAALEARYGGSEFESFAALLVAHGEVVDAPPALSEQVCRDPDDDKFLACALAAAAPMVISRDRALLDVTSCRGIEVVTPRAFVDQHLVKR